ncbi:MAG: hypothetical protein WA040_06230 [Anaerolineae bacterium]
MPAWWRRFVTEPFTQTLADASWFGFVASAILLAAMVNILTGILLEGIGALGSVLILAALAIMTLLFANVYAYRMRQRIAEAGRLIGERSHPAPRRGLIVMVTGAPTARKALDYHREALEHLWLIVTPAMREEANTLRTYAESLGVQCYPLDLVQEYDASRCYFLVRRVFETLAAQVGITAVDVIADMTGGTKPMTAGMALACSDLNAALEHVPTQFVGSGQPTIPLEPIEVVFGRTG